MTESRIKGYYTGGSVIYGFKVIDKKVYINDDEAVIVNRIYQEYAAGKYVKDIIADLHNEGITFRGKPFTKSTVYKILNNEKYSGVYHFNGEIFTNIFPRIVPEKLFDIVCSKREENKFGKHISDTVYILRNKMKCGYCGKSVASESGTARNGTTLRYYKCYGRKKESSKCPKTTIKKDIIEKLVVDTTLKVFEDSEALSTLSDHIIKLHENRIKDTSVLNLLLEEKANISKAIDNLLDAIADGYRSSKTKEKLEEYEIKLDIIEGKILAEKSKEKVHLTKQDIIKFIGKCIKKSPELMIKLLVKEIILYNDRIDIYYNYIDKIGPDDFVHQAFSFYSNKIILDVEKKINDTNKNNDIRKTMSINLFV